MHDYFYVTEVARLALVVGVLASILFYERVQLTTGGAIVPAYLALFLPAPLYVAVTFLSGYLTYFAVSVVLAKRRILYGRRKFEVEMLVGLAFVAIGTLAAHLLGARTPLLLGLTGIGFLVPGVLAHDMFRQGPRRTFLAVGVTTAIVGLFVFVFTALVEIAPLRPTLLPDALPASNGYPPAYFLVAAAASVVVGMGVFAVLGLRSGGFISGAYLAFVLHRPADLLFAAVVAGLTFVLVTVVLMPRLLIFGRRKLSTMVLVGAIVGWAAEIIVIEVTGGAYVPWRGLAVMTIMVPALLANDAQRQGIERTLWGASLTALGVYAITNFTVWGTDLVF